MRVRSGILVLLFLTVVAGCGGDDSSSTDGDASGDPSSRVQGPSGGLTELTVPCAEFSATASKIVEAQTDLYTGSGAEDALDSLVAELDALKDGAPEKVKKALTDLGDGFEKAAALAKDSTATARAELAALATKLSAAGQTVSSYVVEKCS